MASIIGLADDVRAGRLGVVEACAAMEAEAQDPDAVRAVARLAFEAAPLLAYDLGLLAVRGAPSRSMASEIAAQVGFQLARASQVEGAARLLGLALENLEDRNGSVAANLAGLRLECLMTAGYRDVVLKEAPEQIQRAKVLHDGFLELRARLANALCLSRAGAHEQAKTELSLAHDLDPSSLSEGADILVGEVAGEIARRASRFSEALRVYLDLAAKHGAAGRTRKQAYALSEAAMTWEQLGDLERRDTTMKQAAELARAAGDVDAVGRWERLARGTPVPPEDPSAANLLAYTAKLNQSDDADYNVVRNFALLTLDKAKESGFPALHGMARNLLGAVYEKHKRYGQAEAAFRSAIQVLADGGERPLEIRCRINLVMTLARGHRIQEADACAKECLALAHAWRASAGTAELRQTMGAALHALYETMVALHSHTWIQEGEGKIDPSPSDLFSIAQHCQALNLVGWLVLGEAIESGDDPDFRSRVRALRAAETRVERLAAAGADIAVEVGECEGERERLFPRIDPKAASVVGRTPVFSIEQLAEGMPPRSGILNLLCCLSGIACTYVSSNGKRAATLIRWSDAAREQFMRSWSASLRAFRWSLGAARDWRSPEGVDEQFVFDEAPPTIDVLVGELKQKLLAPIAAFLESSDVAHWVVVPQDDLFVLPMSLLEEVLPEAIVSVLPSPAAAKILGRRARTPGDRMYKIGDGTGTLKFSTRELAALKGYQELRVDPTSPAKALGDANRLHFACHGVFDKRQPYDSGLVLGTGTAAGSAGPVETRSEVRLTIATLLAETSLEGCSLVVLSGCCTGQSRLHKANEFTSLPGAFLVSGARDVVASLWPAHDGACVLYMQAFYEALATMGPAAATKKARGFLRDLSREDVIAILGPTDSLPDGERPFASPMFTHVFQHYGTFQPGAPHGTAF
jgi:tetratricopeptide (TPR) repeat protein